MSEMDDVIGEFLVESHENLDRLDQDLVALEGDPSARERLASIFRTIHTIKGTCGFLGFGKLESVAHVGENLLSQLRDGKLGMDAEITSALLAMVDAVRRMLTSIEKERSEGGEDYGELIATLNRLQQGSRELPDKAAPALAEVAGAQAAPAASGGTPSVAVELAPPAPPAATATPGGAPAASKTPSVPARAASADHADSDNRAAAADSSIRVDVTLLDKLMNLVGELVLARNQILQFSTQQQNSSLQATTQRLNLITTELQEGVMKTRMQPIGNVWSKLPRVVRDLSKACGKQARLEMEGKETELDRTIIEAIKDPLTHIVRNSIDHGMESPQERVAAGKSAEGCLFLRAFHEGGQVNIEIRDDGRGIDGAKVARKAVERGLITTEQASRMSPRELIGLIFLPGFSTAEKVTNVSGRGVGMDVVKTNIEKIGGQVDVLSEVGKGTTIKIRIPLTLAIIPALVVTSGGERFAIPQVSLVELVRLEGAQTVKAIEQVLGAPVYRLRGQLLPLVDLGRELALDKADEDAVPLEERVTNIVVLQADDRQFGLIVDEVNDTEEIVVKPLGKQLKGMSLFAGATIMGDGRVALILDVMGIARESHVISKMRDRAHGDAQRSDAATMDRGQQNIVLVALGEHHRAAVPLGMVARLEEFERNELEHVGGRLVVQYREQIMPLHSLAGALGLPSSFDAQGSGPAQVVVYGGEGRWAGLLVDRILDIVQDSFQLQRDSLRPGVIGTAVVQKRVTEVVDLQAVMSALEPERFAESACAGAGVAA